ncbi:PQQ-dependent sugar dehydrogenase [Escherichia coli]|nr:PQQ-dependent sugar dehydrogenase [Escherichia coli]
MKLISRKKAKNYGWPLATWGINYSGFKIPEAKGEIVAGTEQPVFLLERFARRERHGLL